MNVYILRYVSLESGDTRFLAFDSWELANTYGNRAVEAGDINGFTIRSMQVITEID